MSSPTPPPAPIQLRLSSARAGIIVAATFAVPAASAAVAAVIAPGIVWNYVGAVAAVGFGLYVARVYRGQLRVLEVTADEVRLSSLRRQWTVTVGALVGLAVVRAQRREVGKDRTVDVEYDHAYVTFELPADRTGHPSLTRLTLDPTRDPDASATYAANQALTSASALTVRVAGQTNDETNAFVAQLEQPSFGVAVRHPPLRSVRVRGGWSEVYVPWLDPAPVGSSRAHPVWALEDAARLHPDHDLRELRGIAVAVIGTVVWLGDVALLIAALTAPGPS